MRLLNYTSTPGLDRFAEEQRFALYRATHKRLLGEDVAYRRQWFSYVTGLICVAAIPIGCIAVGGLLGVWIAALAALVSGLAVVWLAARQQKSMNKRIGEVLRNEPG